MYYSKDFIWTTDEVEASKEARKNISRIILSKKKENKFRLFLKKIFHIQNQKPQL